MTTPITVAQASAKKTQSQILAQMYDDAAALGVDVVGVQAEAMFRALYEIESRAKLAEVDIRVAVSFSGFLDTSAGTWLTLLAYGVYNLTRNPATKCIRAMSIVAGLLASGGQVKQDALLVRAGGQLFRNKDSFTVTPGQTSTPVLFQAVNAGTAGNVTKGTTVSLVTTAADIAVVDLGIVGVGAAAAVDTEGDPALRVRCRAQFPAVALWGTRLAFARYIQEAFDYAGVPNTVTRFALDDANPLGPGSYAMYLANAAGPATVTEVAIVAAYFALIEKSGSGPVGTFAATAKNIALTLVLKGSSDTATAEALELDLINTVSIGGILYTSEIIGVLEPTVGGASPVMPGLTDVVVLAPAVLSTQLAPFEVGVFLPINITGGP